MQKDKKHNKIMRARELRKDLTGAEKILWGYLRNRNFFDKKFRRQHIFQGFIADFYCPECKLAIEVDGSVHSKRKDYDQARQALLEDSGINFLRFRNKDVFDNLKGVLLKIKQHINPSPSPDGEGRKKQTVRKPITRDEDL